ncbi:hypothetical protein [Solimonas flava]|uniref:hypothetical protein n=1 Tax=Solimonas flava TaxID=415849 RepID=UPI0004813E1B|nr:hypothetical protein [Solimonas flava]
MMKWRKQTVAAPWAVSVVMTAGAWTGSRAEDETTAAVPMRAGLAATLQGLSQAKTDFLDSDGMRAAIALSKLHLADDDAAMPLRTHSPAFTPRKIEYARGRAAAFHPGDAPHRALADAAQALRYEHQLAEASRES